MTAYSYFSKFVATGVMAISIAVTPVFAESKREADIRKNMENLKSIATSPDIIASVAGAAIGSSLAGIPGAVAGGFVGKGIVHDLNQHSPDMGLAPDAIGNPERYGKDTSLGFEVPRVSPGELNQAQRVKVTGRSHILDGDVDRARDLALNDALYNAAMKQNVELSSNTLMNQGVLERENVLMRSKSAILEHRVLEEKEQDGVYIMSLEVIIADPYSTQVCTTSGVRKTVSLYKIRVRSSETVSARNLGTVRKNINQLPPVLQAKKGIRFLNRSHKRFDERQFNLALNNMLYEDLTTVGSTVERRGFILTGDVIMRGDSNYENLSNNKTLQVGLDLRVFDANDMTLYKRYVRVANVETDRAPVLFSMVRENKNDAGGKEIAAFMQNSFDALMNEIECAPLQGRIMMVRGRDIHLNVGQQSGVKAGALLFVANNTVDASMRSDMPMGNEWRMMEIVSVDHGGAIARLIEPEKAASLAVGQKVQFLN